MKLNSRTAEQTLSAFLQKWPVTSVAAMNIVQFSNLADHDAFCYWVEFGSKDLGEIGGMPLTKFGLWKYKIRKEYTDKYGTDNTYAWNYKFGETPTQAFKEIKSRILQIATWSQEGDFDKIEDMEFHAIAKWKIAFMYSRNRLLPIYTREGLLKISAGLKATFEEDAKIIAMQRFILDKKPENQTVIEYAQYLWAHYVEGKPFRNYFIVGSNYNNGEEDIFPEMLATNTIAMGFLRGNNLSHLVGANEEAINDFVDTHGHNESTELKKIKSYLRILLSLKPGDIIAVKAPVLDKTLRIIAYAIVTKKNGMVYEYCPEQLGHHVHVEFVELGINRKTGLNYAGAIHKIDPGKVEHLTEIFGPFLQVDNIALGNISNDPDDGFSDGMDDQNLKSEESYQRGPVASKLIRQLHNIIQNDLFKKLKKKYPRQRITYEYKGQVDILRETETERWLYEVKPYENILSCLREASGQLIEYAYRFPENSKQTNLVIVGPSELAGEAIAHFSHFEGSINLTLTYMQHVAPRRQD